MDPLLHTRDEGTVKTMDFTGSEEGEDCKVGRKGDGQFFGMHAVFISIIFHRSKQSMAIIIGPFQQHFKEKIGEEENALQMLHQDNAQVHTCPALMAKFNEFRYELLPHPAYSDLALCYYFLFPNLKKWFGGKRFTREQLIAETEAYFKGLFWTNHIIPMV